MSDQRIDPLARLTAMEEESLRGGGEARIQRQHKVGKLTARERIDLLVDPGSFVEIDKFVTHRCVDFRRCREQKRSSATAWSPGYGSGRVADRSSCSRKTATVFGGSLSESYATKICKVMDLAMKVGALMSGSTTRSGARIRKASSVARGLRRTSSHAQRVLFVERGAADLCHPRPTAPAAR